MCWYPSEFPQSRATEGSPGRRNRPYPQKSGPVPRLAKKRTRTKAHTQDSTIPARNLAFAAGFCILLACAFTEIPEGLRRRLPSEDSSSSTDDKSIPEVPRTAEPP